MNYFCECIDNKYLTSVPLCVYTHDFEDDPRVNSNVWICLDCLEQSQMHDYPNLVDDLGIYLFDSFPPEGLQGESE